MSLLHQNNCECANTELTEQNDIIDGPAIKWRSIHGVQRKWLDEAIKFFLNAKIQRLPTNPTNTLKLNDYRKNKKCAITDFSPKRHIFLFQKLGCNIEKPLHCSFSTVFDKKKRLTILSK